MLDALSEDIMNEIVNYLEKDRKTLISLSLVSSAFLARCQLHLFRRIEVDIGKFWMKGSSQDPLQKKLDRNIKDLLRIIRQRSAIATYIRILVLRISINEQEIREFTWISNYPVFHEVMSLVHHNLQQLHFSGLRTFSHQSTSILPPNPHLRHFETKFWLPYITNSITKLQLHRLLDIPVSFIWQCKNLTDLSVFHSTLVSLRENETTITRRPRLRGYSMDTSYEATNVLLGWSSHFRQQILDLEDLHTFTCSPDLGLPDEVRCIERILRLSVRSLRVLNVRCGARQ